MSDDSGFHSGCASVPTEQEDRMTSLIERLEAAEVGSRELDAQVWLALNPKGQIAIKATGLTAVPSWRCRVPGHDIKNSWTCPAPATTSLDAALALAGRVLEANGEGWGYKVSKTERGGYYGATLHRSHPTNASAYAEGGSAALSVCAAILKATQSASPSTCGTSARASETQQSHKED